MRRARDPSETARRPIRELTERPMNSNKPTIAYLTAGAAGMYCGSCMHDNTLASALLRQGCDVHLIPTYTPIRTDEEDVSEHQVFYGGINVYLQQKFKLFRRLPGFLDHWLDQPWLIKLLASGRVSTDASRLGELTVSMLRGETGRQSKEVDRLVDWLADHLRPDLINASNMLIAGCMPELKKRLDAPVLVTLQGDDLFLNDLIEPYKSQAFAEIGRIAEQIDGYVVFSRFYADFMAEYLGLPRDRFHIVPLGIKLDGYPTSGPRDPSPRPPTVGYLARICPAKGLHVLVDAFLRLRRMPGSENVRLRVAGWLGVDDRRFFRQQVDKLKRAGAGDVFDYVGVPDRAEKIEFLRSLDVFSAPTVYHEPKGLFVLEALACGVPVVQPDHGAFPETLSATGGGKLVRPEDPDHLAETLHDLLTDSEQRLELGRQGHRSVHDRVHADAMADHTLDVYRQYLRTHE